VIPSVLRWARAWRLPVLAAAVAAAVLGLIALRGLTFDADVLHLLPKQGRAVPAFEQFLQQFGSLDHLYVVFEAPAGHAIDDYQEQIEAFVARLKALPEIERVDAGLFGEGRDWRYLADRVLLMLSAEREKEALERFGAARLPGEVAGARELLGVPSPEVAAMVRQDPLGLFMLMRDQLQGAAASATIDASRGGYVTTDGRAQLVLARPRRPPFDIDFSQQLFVQLARIERESFGAAPHPNPLPAGGAREEDDEPLPPLKVTFAGGHRISIETEREVRAETVWNTVGSLAVILPLLFIAFRSPWLVAVGPLPSALAIVMVLGMYAIAHVTLTAAATGAAAMLFGLGIDGVVLMFVAFRQGISEGKSADESVMAMGEADGPAASMLLGMWTTAATFYGLTIIDFPSLQELGALIGHGMVLCGILTLILVPAMLPRRVT
jgi:predicted exporter